MEKRRIKEAWSGIDMQGGTGGLGVGSGGADEGASGVGDERGWGEWRGEGSVRRGVARRRVWLQGRPCFKIGSS